MSTFIARMRSGGLPTNYLRGVLDMKPEYFSDNDESGLLHSSDFDFSDYEDEDAESDNSSVSFLNFEEEELRAEAQARSNFHDISEDSDEELDAILNNNDSPRHIISGVVEFEELDTAAEAAHLANAQYPNYPDHHPEIEYTPTDSPPAYNSQEVIGSRPPDYHEVWTQNKNLKTLLERLAIIKMGKRYQKTWKIGVQWYRSEIRLIEERGYEGRPYEEAMVDEGKDLLTREELYEILGVYEERLERCTNALAKDEKVVEDLKKLLRLDHEIYNEL